MSSVPLSYRPEIDGLRAVAVLMVVLFHARLGFAGGYTGVDVFFVISGFLITGIVVRSLDTRTFTLSGFWLRRIRRLFPASCVMVLASAVIGWLCTPPRLYVGLGEQILSVLALASNVYLWKTTDYWSLAAEDIPLLHMWSLALEEQFYLVMPVVLMGLHRLGRRWVAPGLLAAMLLSLALCVALTPRAPAWSFYLLPARAWELLVGGLLACFPSRCPSKPIGRAGVAAGGWIGLGLILYGALCFTSTMPFPGWRALVPSLGTILLLYSTGTVGGVLKDLLASPPLRFIGLISYSLYLWHWPLLVFARFAFPDREESPVVRVLALALSFMVSWASWRYIEMPFRNPIADVGNDGRAGTACSSLKMLFALGVMALAVFGASIVETGGANLMTLRGDRNARHLLAAASPSRRTETNADAKGWRQIGRPDASPTVVILGSSHGEMYVPALHECLDSLGVGGAVFARAAENPLTVEGREWQTAGEQALRTRDRRIADFLREHRPRCVLCFHRWSSGIEEAITFSKRRTTSLDEKAAALAGWLGRSVAAWAAHGAAVIVVGEVPQCCSSTAMFEALVYQGALCGREPSSVRATRQVIERHLEAGSRAGYRYVAVESAVQSQPPLTQIRSPDGSQLYYIDDNHLSRAGGELVCLKILCDVIRTTLAKSGDLP